MRHNAARVSERATPVTWASSSAWAGPEFRASLSRAVVPRGSAGPAPAAGFKERPLSRAALVDRVFAELAKYVPRVLGDFRPLPNEVVRTP